MLATEQKCSMVQVIEYKEAAVQVMEQLEAMKLIFCEERHYLLCDNAVLEVELLLCLCKSVVNGLNPAFHS